VTCLPALNVIFIVILIQLLDYHSTNVVKVLKSIHIHRCNVRQSAVQVAPILATAKASSVVAQLGELKTYPLKTKSPMTWIPIKMLIEIIDAKCIWSLVVPKP